MCGRGVSRLLVSGVILAICACGIEEPEERILVSGNIELTEVSLGFKLAGRIVALFIEEGDAVKAGDLIAQLDAEQLERRREFAQARLKAARSRVEELEALLQFQRSSVEAQIEERKAVLGQAEASLGKALAGSRDQEIREAEAAVSRARADYSRAKNDWERGQKLYASEDISSTEHDRLEATHRAASASLSQVQERAELVKKGPREEDIEIARRALQQAQAALKVAETLRLDIRRTEKTLGAALAEIEAAGAELGLIIEQLEDTKLHSPISGTALSKTAELGEVMSIGMPVVTIADLAHPWMRCYIQESDLGRVKLGDRVEVTTDSFPDKVYEGRVSFIASEAEFTPKQIQTAEERVKLVYRIKVDLENPNQELKLNMPLEGEIIVQRDAVSR